MKDSSIKFSSLLGRVRREHAAAFTVAVAPLVYFLSAVAGRLVLCPDDCLTFNLPLRVAASRILLEGHLPLWNPYLFGGMPLLASAQGGLLFPLNWFFFVFDAPVAMNLAVLSTYMLAGLGAYFYARRGGANLAGAIATALIWQFSGFLVGQLGHTNIVQTAALLPWLLWTIDAYAATRVRVWGAAVALVVALETFAGHQQTLAYSLLVAAAYALFMATRREHDAPQRRAYFLSLVLVLAGVALAAVQILPTLELMRNSVRASASYDFFSSFSLPPAFLLTYFAPYILGGGDGRIFRAPYTGVAFYNEYIGYVGVAALALAILAPILRRDARTLFWTVVALVALALALGRFWPYDLYQLIYRVPVLNLFRVPARHLLEVDFALAVLAGRAITAIAATRRERRTTVATLAVAASVFALTCLAVTAWRPADFQLGRQAMKVSLLRAPELFMPVVVAALAVCALWRLARGRRWACRSLLVLVFLDLCLWGQASGWRTTSPPGGADVFWRQTPATVQELRGREGDAPGRYRVLTFRAPFNPNDPVISASIEGMPFVYALQPNMYMMHGVENAAGYDGFGLARYSRLAGEMKLWGDLDQPEQSLREHRALDLLNVRYLLALPPDAGLQHRALPRADKKYGDFLFAEQEIGLPHLEAGGRIAFNTPRIEATRVALVTNLSWSANIPDGATVGRVRLRAEDERVFEFALRAGVDTAEWSQEGAARDHVMRHSLAPVATSYEVDDPKGKYQGHTYVTSFELPGRVFITGGSIEVATDAREPKLGLSVQRISLINDESGAAIPLRKNWFTELLPPRSEAERQEDEQSRTARRWRRAAELPEVWLYENTHALPRAWLATEAVEMPEDALLEVVRTGKFADGRIWEPRQTALLEEPLAATLGGAGASGEARADIVKHEPNRIDLRASSNAPSVLVLSENHYAGWRAYVDGRTVETLRVNYNQRGVLLTPGAHDVRFVYRPKSALFGLLISLVAAALLFVWYLGWPLAGARRTLGGLAGRREAK